ncbi:MAG: hypothetical protein AAFQ80_03105 [Cyanobacteria bacterium J06621_8]
MTVIIIPGIHDPRLSDRLIASLQSKINQKFLLLPTEEYLPYSAIAITQWLNQQPLIKTEALAFISFSAGVVGGYGAALAWQFQGGKISSFIALDGWGMPLIEQFPLYRISHDYFTHWSSGILGGGARGFVADPPVSHLELWRSPDQCRGWRTVGHQLRTRCWLTDYLQEILVIT